MEVEVVVVGQEEVGLLLKPELGQGVGEVGEEVQVVLGQHLVSERKQMDYIKDLEKKDLTSVEPVFFRSVYETLILVRVLLISKKTLQVSPGEKHSY